MRTERTPGHQAWIVRHGETEWTLSGQHTGRSDIELTARGERQAKVVGERLAARPFVRVFSSPLRRALQTARLAGFGDRVEPSELLLEMDYGDYEGLTTPEIRQRRPAWDLWNDGFPAGEGPGDVAARVDEFWRRLGDPGGDVLIFGHGHCLRILAARYLGQPAELAAALMLEPASVSVLGHEHSHPALRRWNTATPVEA